MSGRRDRALPAQHDAMKVAPPALVEVEGRLMQGAPIVPDQHVARPPPVTVLEARLITVPVQSVEQRIAVLSVHVLYRVAAHRVEIEALAARVRVQTHERLPASGAALLLALRPSEKLSRRAAREIGVKGPAPADRFPSLVRQSFIGQVEAGELGVAPPAAAMGLPEGAFSACAFIHCDVRKQRMHFSHDIV